MNNDEEREILDSYKGAIDFWEELFEFECIDNHSCSSIPSDKSSKIMMCRVPGQEGAAWYFANVRLATFHDVELGEAENVAEVLAASSLAISYCPFCGERLL